MRVCSVLLRRRVEPKAWLLLRLWLRPPWALPNGTLRPRVRLIPSGLWGLPTRGALLLLALSLQALPLPPVMPLGSLPMHFAKRMMRSRWCVAMPRMEILRTSVVVHAREGELVLPLSVVCSTALGLCGAFACRPRALAQRLRRRPLCQSAVPCGHGLQRSQPSLQ